MLYYAILSYPILYYTILYYTILYYTILYYTILYYTILYDTIQYDTIRFETILYYTILDYSILYSILSYKKGIPQIIICRILMFMWSFGDSWALTDTSRVPGLDIHAGGQAAASAVAEPLSTQPAEPKGPIDLQRTVDHSRPKPSTTKTIFLVGYL